MANEFIVSWLFCFVIYVSNWMSCWKPSEWDDFVGFKAGVAALFHQRHKRKLVGIRRQEDLIAQWKTFSSFTGAKGYLFLKWRKVTLNISWLNGKNKKI